MKLRVEKDVVNKLVVPMLKDLGCWYFKNESSLSIRGLPDIVGCINGRLFVIECKYSLQEYRQYHPRTALQRHVLRRVTRVGGFATFCFPENLEQVRESLNRIKTHNKFDYQLIEKISK